MHRPRFFVAFLCCLVFGFVSLSLQSLPVAQAAGQCTGPPATRGSYEDATSGTCRLIAAADVKNDQAQCTTGCSHGYASVAPLDPVWGSTLMNGDDLAVTFNLGFTFPFQGTSYTQIHVCTNGFVTLSAVDTGIQYSVSASDFLSGFNQHVPVIALMWTDLITTVYGKTDNSEYALITWDGINWGTGGAHVSFQLVLRSSGTFQFLYNVPFDYKPNGVLTGFSSGAGNTGSPVDILQAVSPVSITTPDYYSYQGSSGPFTLIITKQLMYQQTSSSSITLLIDPSYSASYSCDGATGNWQETQVCTLATNACTAAPTSTTVDLSAGTGSDPTCSSISATNALLPAETCKVACLAGYVLVSGSLAYTCTSGTLVMNNPPVCEKRCIGPPPYATESDSSIGDCKNIGSTAIAVDQSTCQVGCKRGYEGPSHASTVTWTCNAGTWQATSSCSLVSGICSSPLSSTTTIVASGGSGADPTCASLSSTNLLLPAETCHVACATGHYLSSGALTYTCTSGALTSGPTCSPIQCASPPSSTISSSTTGTGTCPAVGSGAAAIAPGVSCTVGCADGFQGSDLDLAFGSPVTFTSYGSLPANDEGTAKVTLGFSFSFLGGSYTDVYINSNGMVELGGSAHYSSFTGSVNAFLASSYPIIAAAWANLVGPAYFKTSSTEAVITWDSTYFSTSASANMGDAIQIQLHLYSDGSFKFIYFVDTNVVRESSILVGFSAGQNAANPGSQLLSDVSSVNSATHTLYQSFLTTTEQFTLASRVIFFSKSAVSGDYTVSSTSGTSTGYFTCAATATGSVLTEAYSGAGCIPRTSLPCTSPPMIFQIDFTADGDTCGQVSPSNPLASGQSCKFSCKRGYSKSQNRDLMCVDGAFEPLRCDGYLLSATVMVYGTKV